MRDALGGVVSLQLIIVFLVIVNGYLAFSVNYTKAFRVKNKVITTIEQYNGLEHQDARDQIQNYMRQIGYVGPKASDISMEGGTCVQGYCYRKIDATGSGSSDVTNLSKSYYRVQTYVYIDIPIINKILPRIFQVSGETKILYD